MYNRNHTCLVSSLFSVLVERLVSVVVKCVVKDQQVGPFVQASFKSLSKKFQLYNEPRARLPVRPGGLCKRRLDGTLSVSY